jgi:hypothetical protein
MARAQLAAVKDPPARSGERQSLAAAIDRHAAAVEHLAKIHDAAERATAIWSAAVRAEGSAEDALAEAQAGEGAALAASIIAGGELVVSPVEEAEQTAAKAAAHLRRAGEARDLVRQQIPVAEHEVEETKGDVEEAVRAVVRSAGRDHITRLVQEAQVRQAELIERRIALRYLWRHDLAAEPEAIEFLLQGGDLVARFGSAEAQDFDRHAASEPWRAACEALRHDAAAPLP